MGNGTNLTFKKEMDFAIDNFGQQKYHRSIDSISSILLNLFFMRPGTMPSMPELGINISSYLYQMTDELDTTELKDKIQMQCSDLLPYLIMGDINVSITKIQGQDVLVLSLSMDLGQGQETALYGFTKDKTTGETLYNYDTLKNYK